MSSSAGSSAKRFRSSSSSSSSSSAGAAGALVRSLVTSRPPTFAALWDSFVKLAGTLAEVLDYLESESCLEESSAVDSGHSANPGLPPDVLDDPLDQENL